MSEPVRLAKRVIALTHCSRREAEQYIEGGWVRVDGEVVDRPQFMVDQHQVEVDPAANLTAVEPMTMVLHQPRAAEASAAGTDLNTILRPETRWAEDRSGIRLVRRHLQRLSAPLPLPALGEGLLIATQDGRLLSRLAENLDRIEQEFVVEVRGEIQADGLALLNHGLHFNRYAMPPSKVSWQSEHRLRFAIKRLRATQIEPMCQAVGLQVVAIKRLRVGRIALAQLPPGQWRFLAPYERF